MLVRIYRWSCIAVVLGLVLTACLPSASPSPSAAPTQTPEPQPPIAGLEAGAQMRWLDGSVLIYIPAGESRMGAGGGDHPEHIVRLNGFWIQQTKVTNRMYAACARSGLCDSPSDQPGLLDYNSPSYGNKPVVGVNWAQAQVYCTWIQGRLPTEAEWEKAARGSDGVLYPWGEAEPDCTRLNFNNCFGRTSSVTGYPSGKSPYGLLDMAGNVFEWVADWYDPQYYHMSPADSPLGPGVGNVRSVRGSGFGSAPGLTPSFVRSFDLPSTRRGDLGFRCVVPSPMLFPPFCQLNAIQLGEAEAATPPVGGCEPPGVVERGQFCQKKKGYANVDIPQEALVQVESDGFNCVEVGIFEGMKRLSCYGAERATVRATVCSAACSTSLNEVGGELTCDPGYGYNPSTKRCEYSPVLLVAESQSCPPGFVDTGLNDKAICLPAASDERCPVGQYYDRRVNACLPGGGGTDCLLYGFSDQSLAQQCYQGCQSRYAYNPVLQCCQGDARGMYLRCEVGYHYEDASLSCLPGPGGLSGIGCTTISLYTPDCVTLECGVYPNCRPECTRDKKKHICVPSP